MNASSKLRSVTGVEKLSPIIELRRFSDQEHAAIGAEHAMLPSIPCSASAPAQLRPPTASPCSAIATTRTPPASVTSPMSDLNAAEARIAVRRDSEVEEDDDENGSSDHRLVFSRAGSLFCWLGARSTSCAGGL